jgi:hypothetical protein
MRTGVITFRSYSYSNSFRINELQKCISMLGQTPVIIAGLGFLRGN